MKSIILALIVFISGCVCNYTVRDFAVKPHVETIQFLENQLEYKKETRQDSERVCIRVIINKQNQYEIIPCL